MDWFDQDDNMFQENDRSFIHDTELNIENVFLKQNSFADYEIKMDDFVLKNNERIPDSKLLLQNTENYNGIESVNDKDIILSQTQNKIFSINKDIKKVRKSNEKRNFKNKILTKEELARHPFLSCSQSDSIKETSAITSSPSSKQDSRIQQINIDNLISQSNNYDTSTRSVENNSEYVINSHSKDQEDSKDEQENSYHEKYCHGIHEDYSSNHSNSERYECDSLINNTGNYSTMGGPLNLINGLNPKIIEKNQIFRNFNVNFTNANLNPNCTGDSSCPYSLYVPFQSLPLSERMRIKKEKAKMLLEKKTKRDISIIRSSINQYASNLHEGLTSATSNSHYSPTPLNFSQNLKNLDSLQQNQNNSFNSEMPEVPSENKLSKKEIKMLRNRISAQRSRDRKKKEMDEIKFISQNLLNETCLLKKELENKDKEINYMKEQLSQLCKNCHEKINFTTCPSVNNINNVNKKKINKTYNNQNNGSTNYSLVDSSTRRFNSSLKYSLMAGFLVVFCLIGTLSFNYKNSKFENNTQSNFSGRILNSINDKNIDIDISLKTSEKNNLSTALTVYNLNSLESTTNNSPHAELNNTPFKIVKDLNKFIEKKMSIKSKKLDDDFQNNSGKKESSYLGKKRMEFFSKMQKRQTRVSRSETENLNGFLQNNSNSPLYNFKDMCPNTEGLAWSIQVELSLNEEQESQILNEEHKRGIILKEKSNFKDYIAIVPVNEARYVYEKSVLRDNIKSMYCRDFITTAEENSNMFKNLFNKLNEKINLHQESEEKYFYFILFYFS